MISHSTNDEVIIQKLSCECQISKELLNNGISKYFELNLKLENFWRY